MKLVDASIRYPVTVVVGVLIAFFGGLLSLTRVPIQLTPDIAVPIITVTTTWLGGSPEEVEKEIVEEQEELLKSVEGVLEMASESRDSVGTIFLKFDAGTDMNDASLRVSNKLNEVLSYPENADRPVITTVNRFDRSITWYVIRSTEPPDAGGVYVPHLETLFDDVIKPRFERVEGVASVNFFGGLPRELHVVFDPDLLASTGISIPALAAALQAQSRDISGGDFGEGKRRYVVRTMGRYRSPEDVAETVIEVRGGVPIRVGDVAEVELAYQKPRALVRFAGEPAIAFNVQRQIGGNVLEIMAAIDLAEKEVQAEILGPRGMTIENAYRESVYIEDSIDRVMSNIYLGAFLAIVILFLFLRSPSSLLIVALSIPISVVTSFFALDALGRTINVISLAGMAFAVGMVVDNAIVVLENIYRHLQMGKRRRQAAADGTTEVWGAVFASTITTVAVFLPLLFIQERAAQLFRDIALAISASIVISMVVAMTVIPSAAARVLKTAAQHKGKGHEGEDRETFLARLATRISNLVEWINAGHLRRLVVTAAIVGLAVGATWLLLPSAEYLPNGNQNFIFGFLLPPPGYNMEEMSRVSETIEAKLAPYWSASDADAVSMPGGGLRNFWFAMLPEMSFFGVEARDPERIPEVLPVLNGALGEVPGAIGFAAQQSLFQDGSVGGTRSVRIDITGPELETILSIAGRVFREVGAKLPGSSSRPIPGLDLGNPEVRIYPDRVRMTGAGLNAADVGRTVSSLVDGLKVAEYFDDGREIDLLIKGRDGWSQTTQSVERLPLTTPGGEIITLGDIARVEQRQGPVQINHMERRRAVSIETVLPDDLALEQAIESIESEILAPLRDEGLIGGLYDIHLSGAADDLSRLRGALARNFLLVVLLTFLLLAALFQSFLYPIVILLTVPLATFGGVLGLRLVQLFVPGQQMDILTMLGFVILVGTVINNSILIVYQSLRQTAEGMDVQHAVRESVRVRVRPILMSTMTSSLGMLPLVVMPGAGSELYRGLGSVVVGGLVVSTGITLVLTPLVFTFAYEMRAARARRLGWDEADGATSPPPPTPPAESAATPS